MVSYIEQGQMTASNSSFECQHFYNSISQCEKEQIAFLLSLPCCHHFQTLLLNVMDCQYKTQACTNTEI